MSIIFTTLYTPSFEIFAAPESEISLLLMKPADQDSLIFMDTMDPNK